MTNEQMITELKAMIEADARNLAEALTTGHRVHAHRYVDAIIDNSRELEDRQLAQGYGVGIVPV